MKKWLSFLFVGVLAIAAMGCGGGSRIVKINPYNNDIGFLSFEEKVLLRQALRGVNSRLTAKLPTKGGTTVWVMALDRAQDPAFKKLAHNILQTGFLHRGLWIGGEGKPAASLQKKGFLSLLNKAAALAGTKGGSKGLWNLMPPRDPFIDKLFMSMLYYGNGDNAAHSTIEDSIIQALTSVRKCTVLERDREVMLNLAAQYLVTGKLEHSAANQKLKRKMAIPDKILAYRIVLLRKELFKGSERANAGHPDKRTHKVRRLWLQIHLRLIDTATSKIEWTGFYRSLARQQVRPND